MEGAGLIYDLYYSSQQEAIQMPADKTHYKIIQKSIHQFHVCVESVSTDSDCLVFKLQL